MRPQGYDPLLEVVPVDKLSEILKSMANTNSALAKSAPTHDSYFTARAAPAGWAAAAT